MPLDNDSEINPTRPSEETPPDQTNDSLNASSVIIPPPNPAETPRTPHQTQYNSKGWWKDRKYVLELCGFVVLAAYTGFACLQWLQIRYTNNLTARALDSSNSAFGKTLDKMQLQVDAATSFAKSANSININLSDAVKKLKDQTDTMDRTRELNDKDATEALQATIDNFHQDERAWIGIDWVRVVDISLERGVLVDVRFRNTGKTPPRHMFESVGFNLEPAFQSDPLQPYVPTKENIASLIAEPMPALAPQDVTITHFGGTTVQPINKAFLQWNSIIAASYEQIMNRSLILYYYGQVLYEDVYGTKRTTDFCFYIADPFTKRTGYCKGFNELY